MREIVLHGARKDVPPSFLRVFLVLEMVVHGIGKFGSQHAQFLPPMCSARE